MITNNIKYLAQALWHRSQTWIIHQKSKNIIKCGNCKKFLHCPKNPVGISHSRCLKCAYKALGGTIPRLPRVRDLRLYKSLLNRIVEVRDSAWTGQKIYQALFENGEIQANAISQRQPLTSDERNKIYFRRLIAYEHGYSRQYVNHVEMLGAGYGV